MSKMFVELLLQPNGDDAREVPGARYDARLGLTVGDDGMPVVGTSCESLGTETRAGRDTDVVVREKVTKVRADREVMTRRRPGASICPESRSTDPRDDRVTAIRRDEPRITRRSALAGL
jgi:hypothetical protein